MNRTAPLPGRRRRGTLYAWLGGFLLLAAVAIPLIVSLGLYESFQRIEKLAAPTPSELGASPQTILLALAIGAFLALSGVALLLLWMIDRNRGDVTAPRVSE